jgi:N-acetylglucosamine-6-phosphate deacetylase
LLDASKMASATPAQAFGWYVGTIEQYRLADAVVLGPDLAVQKVLKRGEWLP